MESWEEKITIVKIICRFSIALQIAFFQPYLAAMNRIIIYLLFSLSSRYLYLYTHRVATFIATQTIIMNIAPIRLHLITSIVWTKFIASTEIMRLESKKKVLSVELRRKRTRHTFLGLGKNVGTNDSLIKINQGAWSLLYIKLNFSRGIFAE